MSTILVIDDKQDNLLSISSLLKNLIPGCRVLTAGSGPEGIEKANTEPVDTILLDIHMPGMDGFEACKILKSDEATKHIPIIMLTAVMKDSASFVKGLEQGADAFFTKPIDKSELTAQVRAMLRIKKAEDQLLREKNLLAETVQVRTAELKDSETKYQDLYDNAPDMFCSVDAKTEKIIQCNQTLAHQTGYTKEEIIGRPIFERYHSDCLEEAKKTFQLFLSSGEADNVELQLRKKDGGKIDVCLNSSSVRDKQGNILYSRSIWHDVSDRKAAEENLKQSQKMESVGTLAGGVAHEFNNILGGILGYTEIAIDDAPEGSPVCESLDEILKLSLRAREVVKQILSFSRKGKKDLKPLHPHLIIEESLKVLRSSIPTTIEIRQNINEQSGTILADQTQIHQINMNLCMNAAHAMEDSGGVLEIVVSPVVLDAEDVKPYPDLKTGEYIKLTVSDTGTGIDPNNIDKIFDPFFTTKGVGKGTGMGLSVVHGIIKDHGGVINVSSKLGEGTTFTIFLPKTEARINKTESDDALPTGTENILVVDDEEHLVFLLKKNMERLGYKVTAMTNSLETLELFKKDPHRYDLIITDLTMPHLTGDRLASKVTAIRPDMPVIIATGYADAIDSDKVKQSGIKAFIPKPYQKEELAKTIRLILD